MPLSHPDDSWLIELLNGLLSDDQRGEVLAHVRGCPKCEARMRTLARERELLRSSPIPVIENVRPIRRIPRRVVAIAAAIAAAIIVVVISLTAERRTGDDAYWIPVAAEERTVMRSQGSGAELENALAAYERHDAKRAVEELRQHTVSDNETTRSLHAIFLASALLNSGHPEETLKSLDELHAGEYFATLPQPWRDRALWIQYLALRQLGREADAQAVLTQLKDSTGEIGERARRQLTNVNRDRPSG